jgi:hypothetical protein
MMQPTPFWKLGCSLLNSAPIASTVNRHSMAASDKFRNRAIRLFASALTAREGGISTAAQIDGITNLAIEALAQAEDMDHVAAQQPQSKNE